LYAGGKLRGRHEGREGGMKKKEKKGKVVWVLSAFKERRSSSTDMNFPW
jgi:hypothetical protein